MPTDDEGVAIRDERDDLPIFIHSELDDARLSVYEFRVYGHFARRAGGPKGCYESIPSMATVMLIDDKTVRTAIKGLMDRNMISRVDRIGKPSVYRLLPKSAWSLTPAVSGMGPNTEGEPLPDTADKGSKKGNPSSSSSADAWWSHNPFGPSVRGPVPPDTRPCLYTDSPIHKHPVEAAILSAILQVPKYDRCKIPPTRTRVVDLAGRLMAAAPTTELIVDMLKAWVAYHAADSKSRFGKDDPLSSIRNNIAHYEPKWASLKHRASSSGTGLVRPDTPKARKQETIAEKLARVKASG